MKRIAIGLALSASVLVLAPNAWAQSEFERDLRGQGYVFGGVGAMSQVGSTLYEFGGGYDWLVHGGIGIGGEVSVLGDSSSGVGTGGFNVSYHFLPSRPGFEPFVVGGMSFGSGAEYGLDGYTWATAGAGSTTGSITVWRFGSKPKVDSTSRMTATPHSSGSD